MLYFVIGDFGNYLFWFVIVFGIYFVWDSNFCCNGYIFLVNCLWFEGELWFLYKIVWYFKGYLKGKLKSCIWFVFFYCEIMNVFILYIDC